MISVVLCTYNDSDLLMPAIMSCLKQDTEVEIVLVDDCSSKEFNEDVKAFISNLNNVNYIRHGQNMGLSAARNTGIDRAKNSLVIPLDADDHFFPNVLGKMEKEFKEGTDIVYGNILSLGRIDYPAAQPFSKELMSAVNPLFCSSMFTKDIWKKAGGYLVRQGPHYEDWNFWNKCFMVGANFKYIDLIVYEHVERGDSMLRKLAKEREKYVTIATEPLKRL